MSQDFIVTLLARIEALAIENHELKQADTAHKEDVEYMSGRLASRDKEIDTLRDTIANLNSKLEWAERDKNNFSRRCSNLEEQIRQINNDKLPKLPDMKEMSFDQRQEALKPYIVACGSRDKIHCIKVVREALCWGLKEAKDFVESIPGACTGPHNVTAEFAYR